MKLKEITSENFWQYMNYQQDYTMILPDKYVKNIEAGEKSPHREYDKRSRC